MKKIFAYLAMFTAAATFVACENAPEGNVTPDATGKPIEITIGDESRALLDLTDGKSVTWEAGDQVGFFHHVNGTVSETANNKPYTAGAAGATATFTGEATWSGTAEDTHNIYVYYPYRDRANTADLIVIQMTKDQTYDVTAPTWSVGATYGFAYGKADNVEYGKAVEIGAMKQYFGILRLNITNGTTEDVTISKVSVTTDKTGPYGSHRVSIKEDVAEVIALRGAGKTITTTVANGLVKAGESIDVRLVISPRDYSSSTFSISIDSDKGTHPVISFAGGNVAQGERIAKKITLDPVATVDEPEYKNPLYATAYDKNGDKGVIFWVDDVANPTKAKIVSTKSYGPHNWWSDTTLPVVNTGADDGAANMTLIETAAGANIEKYLSYMDCKTEGEGWYLPANNEWDYLLDTYYNVDNHTTLTTNPSAMAAEPIAARNKFEDALVALGGKKLNQEADTVGDGTTYYTSTENSANKVQVGYACTGKPRISNAAKYAKSPKRYTRCIKVVDLTE